jgi:signal peptidase I
MSAKTKEEKSGGGWLETIGVIVVALVVALLVQQFLVKPYKIPSESMVPTLVEGQRVLVNRIANDFSEPKHDQVIVFNPPAGAGIQDSAAQCSLPRQSGHACTMAIDGKLKTAFVKRLIGLPGDTISVKQGAVTRNGKELDEPYAQSCDGEICNIKEFKVPAERYFMMGDNRGNSDDSRFWGPLPRDYMIGRAFATYWPIKRIGTL